MIQPGGLGVPAGTGPGAGAASHWSTDATSALYGQSTGSGAEADYTEGYTIGIRKAAAAAPTPTSPAPYNNSAGSLWSLTQIPSSDLWTPHPIPYT